MPDEPIKGIPEAYDEVCNCLKGEPFMDWIDVSQNGLSIGQICETTVNYAVDERWYLEIANQASSDESQWLWKVNRYNGVIPPKPSSAVSVARHFGLEIEENIVAVKTKQRPVVLLHESLDDWVHPNTPGQEFNNWYVAPAFSYRKKHRQSFVERDQQLENSDNFYLPPLYSSCPGMKTECALRFHTIQSVPTKYLKPMKQPCAKASSRPRCFGLTETGVKIVATHFYQAFNLFPELTTDEGLYNLFVEGVRDLYEASN